LKIHGDAFFQFDEIICQPSGHPLGCAALWRQFARGETFYVRLE
jgi:hypothetical protein